MFSPGSFIPFASASQSEAAVMLLVAGQSNARSYSTTGNDVPVALQTPDAGVQIWNTTSQQFEQYAAGSNSDTWNSGAATPQKWGPEAGFAHQFRAANPNTVLYIVKLAVDSTGIATDGANPDWDPSSVGDLYDSFTTEINAAKADLSAALVDAPVVGLLWMQGEQDSLNATNAGNYGVNITSFINALRTDWGDQNTKIVIGRISNSSLWTNGPSVRSFQMRAGRDLSGVDVVDTDGYTREADNKHYTPSYVQTLGEEMYTAYSGNYPLIPVRYEDHSSKTNSSIVLSNNNLTAEGSGTNSSALMATHCTGTISGKNYWEMNIDGKIANLNVGAGKSISVSSYFGATADSVGYSADGKVWKGGVNILTYSAYTTGDRINIAVDSDTGQIWFGKNGVWNGDPAAGTGEAAVLSATTSTSYNRPGATLRRSGDIISCVFTNFTDPIPAGFSEL